MKIIFKKKKVQLYQYQKKIDFKSKKATRDKEGHYILIKDSIQLEYITIINSYALNNRPLKHVK